MTQEEKDLLLKDLCARLPYRTIIRGIVYEEVFDDNGEETDEVIEKEVTFNLYIISENSIGFQGEWISLELCKPYLRPMSSMTEEEEKEYSELVVKSLYSICENNESATTMANDWYLSKGFDVRNLIPKGLALEAPKNMYKYG